MIGLGIVKDEASVKAMSRTGDRREILYGPLFYGIVFVVMTLIYWKDTPTGMVALMLMCGGDGLADIMGRGIKSPKLPWNPGKSVVGSAGMFIGGWVLAAFITGVFVLRGSLCRTLWQLPDPHHDHCPGRDDRGIIAIKGCG